MIQEQALLIVQEYTEGWKQSDAERILNTLHASCIITESHGPVYQGKDHVRGWLEGWKGSGSKVLKWDILSFIFNDGQAAYQWDFECVTRGTLYVFRGMSHIVFQDGLIHKVNEYCMTQPPYAAPAIYC